MNIKVNPNLKDKVVVITGGAGVLGSAFTKAVAQAGAKVVILGRNEEKAQHFADELIKEGYQALGVGANVLDLISLEQAHQKVLSTFGKTNILINCAGGNDPKATTQDEYFNQSNYETKSTRGFFDLDPIAFNDVFGLNFTGTLLPTQIFAKDMIGLPHSTIVNISSMSAFNPLTKIPAYSAAKAAINNFTQWLAVHVAAGFFYGLPERPIKSISLENIKFTYAINPVADIPAMMSFLDPMTKQGLQFRHVDSVSINNVDIKGQDGEEILIENVNSYSKI